MDRQSWPRDEISNAVPTDGASVVFASWEDEPEEFYRRLHQISGRASPWVKPERLEKLRIVNLAGGGRLWRRPRAGTSPPWRS